MNRALLNTILGMTVFLVAGPALATTSDPEEVTRQFQQSERDIPSLYLVNGMCLSEEQSGKLAGVLEDVLEVNNRLVTRAENLSKSEQKRVEDEISRIVDLVASGRKISEEKRANMAGVRRMNELKREVGKLRSERDEKLRKLAGKACEIFTPSQQAILGRFVPCFIPPGDFRNPERVGQAAGDTSHIEKALEIIRTDAKKDKNAAVQTALDKLIPYTMEKRHIKYTKEAEKEVREELASNLNGSLDKLLKMSEADFQIEKGNMAVRIVPLPKTDTCDDPEATKWKVQRYVLNPGIIDVLQKRAVKNSKTEPAQKNDGGKILREKDVTDAMRTAAMLEGLQLSKEQAEQLLPIVKEAVDAKNKIQEKIVSTMTDAAEPYAKLRDELAGGLPTPKSENAAMKFHGRAKNLNEEKMVDELLKYEEKVDSVLSANQIEFMSCESPKMLKSGSEEAAGVGDAALDARNLLTACRRMSEISFQKEKKKLTAEFVNDVVDPAALKDGSVNVDTEAERCALLLDSVRKMKQEDFNKKLNDLVAELCPKRSKPRDPVYGARYVKGEPLKVLNESTRLLFGDVACKILEKMVGQGK